MLRIHMVLWEGLMVVACEVTWLTVGVTYLWRQWIFKCYMLCFLLFDNISSLSNCNLIPFSNFLLWLYFIFQILVCVNCVVSCAFINPKIEIVILESGLFIKTVLEAVVTTQQSRNISAHLIYETFESQ